MLLAMEQTKAIKHQMGAQTHQAVSQKREETFLLC